MSSDKNHEHHIINPNNSVEKKEENKDFKGSYGVSAVELQELQGVYEKRKFDEDLQHFLSFGGVEALETKVKTNLHTGLSLSESEFEERRIVYGSNAAVQEPLPNICSYVWESLGDLMIRILIVAGVIQLILGSIPAITQHPETDWVEGLSIIIAVFVVVCVGSYTNYTKEKKFKELNDKNAKMIKIVVKRDGISKELSPDDILVGDLVKVSTGSIIPADGIVVASEGQMKVEEASLTGESDLMEKETLEECLQRLKDFNDTSKNKNSLPSPFIFSGTLVKEGGCWFITTAVGSRSAKGAIEENVQQNQENEDSKTPLEDKLDTIANQIGYFGIAAGLFTLIALFIRFGVQYASQLSEYNNLLANPEPGKTPNDPKLTVGTQIVNIFLLCIAIVVVAIPEGLPLAVTLSLAFSINKMMHDNNLVRKMYACETMGGANFICTDKTGTLTMNVMNIFKLYDGKDVINLKDVAMADESKKDAKTYDSKTFFASNEYFSLFTESVLCNVQMIIDENNNISNESKTDLPFAKILKKFGVSLFPIQTQFRVNQQHIQRIAFSSSRKKMSTIVSHSSFKTGYRIYMKGASEIVLGHVSNYLNPVTCEKVVKTDLDFERFKEVINHFANETLRTICVAYKDITETEAAHYLNKNEDGNFLIEETGFTMVCIAGIKDTLREGVREAIAQCNTAGINVVMVTGDLKETAIAISKECGIWKIPEHAEVPEYYSLTGEEFFTYIGGIECSICGKDIKECKDPKTKAQALKENIDFENIQKHRIKDMKMFEKIITDLRVLARSRPMDKYALVLGLRALENVVAVTGDGTNDAQALSKSDVGFAMGIEGTDIAKDAADIIILDDNFASIVKAVLWGRNIYDCIRKFIQFQLTVNIAACFLVFVTSCIGSETPITAIQMLWLNMIMDSLGSLALATEPPDDEILNRDPNDKNEHIINPTMWKHILANSIVLFSILIGIYLRGQDFLPEDDPQRMAEIDTILRCYQSFPGIPPVNGKYTILSGSQSNWPSSVNLKPDVTEMDCGSYIKYQNLSFALSTYKSLYGNTTHITMMFNMFVFYTLFNQINARVIKDELNIFRNIFKNYFFIFICLCEMGLQALLIQVGYLAFNVSFKGLTGKQWGICIGFGAITFAVSFIMKFIPIDKVFMKKSTSAAVQPIPKVIENNETNRPLHPQGLNQPSESKRRISREHSKKKTLIENMRKTHPLENKQSSRIRGLKEVEV